MRYKRLSPFRVMDIVAKAKEFDDTIHFEIGEPDLPPPPKVREALKKVDSKIFSYTPTLGIFELREKIANHYKKVYNIEIDVDQILITPGTSIAFMIAYELLLPAKGKLAISDPSYPCYKNFAYMVDGEVETFVTSKENNFSLNKELLESRKKEIDLIHISSPANPTGILYDNNNLKELIEFAKANNIGFISDELYHGLVYEKEYKSALEFSKDIVVINGFSKYFCMPGFRLGWIILPKELIRYGEIIAQNLYISAPTISQYVALEAFDYNYLEEVREIFKKRRDFLYNALEGIFNIPIKPDGAFYIWADISKYSDDSLLFANRLLSSQHVAVTPGIDFGKEEAKKYIRFAYTKDIEELQKGVDRILKFISSF